MRVFRYFLPVAALFIIALQSPERPTPGSGQFQDFTLTLATPKASYLELQPVPLVITLKNETGSPLVGHNVLEFGSAYLRLYIDRDDGPHEIQVSPLIKNIYANSRVFQPGEEVKNTERLSFRLNEVFPKPGTYKLHVRLNSSEGKQRLLSKPIEVQIVQPDGLDAHALQFIREHSQPANFFTGILAVKNPEQLQVLENFVAVYGESSYGDEAALLLAQVQFAKREYEKARKSFERLAKKPGYAFASEASDYLKLITQREAATKQRQ